MRKWMIVAFVVLMAVVLGFLEPSGTVRALVVREPFAQGRPVSHWRRVVRNEYTSSGITEETEDALTTTMSIPVLKQMAHDDDEFVRAASVYLLSRTFEWTQVEAVLLDRLEHDDSIEVRYQAIEAFRKMGRNSLPAVPMLKTIAADDSNIRLMMLAHEALWNIHPEAAGEVGDWQKFESEEYGYSIQLPGTPKFREVEGENSFGEATVCSFFSTLGTASFAVGVSDSPKEVQDMTTEQGYEWIAENVREFVGHIGLEIFRNEPIDVAGHEGRTFVLGSDKVTMVQRSLMIGDKSYAVVATVPESFDGYGVLTHFFDSFTLLNQEPESGEP